MNQTNGLKLLAFLIAVILWAYVRVTVGGVTQNSITQLELQIPLEMKGQAPHLIPYERSSDTIKLTLRGDSEVVTELRQGLVRAYVDLENMSAGSAWPEVQVLVPAGVHILNVDPNSVNVRLSPEMVKEVPIKIETAGAPKEGYKVGIPLFEPKTVKVDGPEELVTQVNFVSGVVPVDDFGESVVLAVNNLVPVNANNTAVMGTDSSLRLATREVRVTIPIERRESVENLPILTENVKVNKQPGYTYDLVTEPQYVQISTTLNGESLPSGVQATAITLSPVGETMEEVAVDLMSHDGIRFVGASKVTIKVIPKKIETKEKEEKK